MKQRDVVIVGAGLAGAATAWWLRRMGADRLLLLEQEPLAGGHASGKNAGIARQAAEDLPTSVLCARGTAFLKSPPEGFCNHPLIQVTGGYLLVNGREDHHLLNALQRMALAAGAEAYPVDRAAALAASPLLRGAPFTAALHCPGDGVVDIHALLSSYLRGAEVVTGARVTGFESEGRRLRAVTTDRGTYRADLVVNAAGAWADEVARLAGSSGAALSPKRRHLLHTGPVRDAEPGGPYLWCVAPPLYVRPESGGYLMCPCDEEPSAPCAPPVDPEAAVWLAERLRETLPALSGAPVARVWAELRTFSRDGGFLVGRDPQVANLFWVAALGGHGMTASAAVGELAASLILGAVPPVEPGPFDPRRFA